MAHTTQISLDDRIREMLGGRMPSHALASMEKIKLEPASLAASEIFSEVSSKAAYLSFVAQYKALIKDVENEIRKAKAARRSADFYTRCRAQSEAQQYACAATALILLRRLGKAWSAVARDTTVKAA